MSHQETGALIIIFDVGKSVSTPLPGDGKTFFEKSRDCISWILRRKILSMSPDLVSILVTGTDEEGESLNDVDITLCRNISIKYDFQLASWEMLDYIDNKIKPRDEISDWLGTLLVAIEKLKIIDDFYKVSSKTVVIFSDLTYTFTEAVASVVEGIRSFNIEVNVIGSNDFSQMLENKELINEETSAKKPRLEEEISDVEKNELISGDRLLYILWRWVGGLITVCSFSSALRHLSCYVKKKVRATPWNCVMDIGAFKISVQVFKKIDRKPQHRPKLKCQRYGNEVAGLIGGISQSELVQVKRDKIMYYKCSDASFVDAKEVSVDEDDVVAGYRYGSSIIPFSDEDKFILSYKPGKKSFSILGFTNIDNIPYYALAGEGCYIVVPRDKDAYAEVAFSALVQAMSETGNAAVVRRVYSENRGLSLGVLYPIVEEQGESNYKECLIYTELAFHEDIRIVRLPKLGSIKKKMRQEQYDLIDNLIDEMDLMHFQSDAKDQVYEELDLSSRHEVKNQFFSHCIAAKALNPNEPLPEELPQHCLKSITLPDLIANKAEKFDEKLSELFSIRANYNETDSVIKPSEVEKSVEISMRYTFTSENDKTAENCFRRLFDKHVYPPPEEIRNLLEMSVKTFHFKDEEIVEAFLKLTCETRRKTIENYADDYNYWMRRLRIHLGREKQLERNYWKGVLQGNLGLITVEEHSEACMKKEDAEFFIKSLMANDETEAKAMKITKEEEEEAINMLF